MYAKLENGVLIQAPKMLPSDDGEFIIYNPPAEVYREHGYYPVVFTEMPIPPEGYYYDADWEQEVDSILQIWVLYELPDEVDDAEAYRIIFGEDE